MSVANQAIKCDTINGLNSRTLWMKTEKKRRKRKHESRRCQPTYHSSPFDKYLIGATGCAAHNNKHTAIKREKNGHKTHTQRERERKSAEIQFRMKEDIILCGLKIHGAAFYCLKIKNLIIWNSQLIRIDFVDCFTVEIGTEQKKLATDKFVAERPPTKPSNGTSRYQKPKTFPNLIHLICVWVRNSFSLLPLLNSLVREFLLMMIYF